LYVFFSKEQPTEKNFQGFCDEYFADSFFLEETKFDILFLDENSLELQELVGLYNKTYNFYVFCHFRKLLSQEEISQTTFSFFLEKFKTRTAEDLFFLAQKNSPNSRTFSKNSKVYGILLRIWSLFIPYPSEVFITKRIRDTTKLLKNKINTYSIFEKSNKPLRQDEQKTILVWYNFYLGFVVKFFYGRQQFVIFAQNLSNCSFFYYGVVNILFTVDNEILVFLRTLTEYLCLAQELLKKSKTSR
jgi:hypothetical protein